MDELNGLIKLILSSIKHNKPAKFFEYFPDVTDRLCAHWSSRSDCVPPLPSKGTAEQF